MGADALDHVGIQRALRQEVGAADARGLLLEHLDEHAADCFALGLGVGHAVELRQEQVARVAVHELDVEPVAEGLDDLLRLALPQQAAVHEDAGQLVAHGLMDQRGGNRAIDPAGQAADHPAGPDLGADAGHLRVAEARHAPIARQPGDAMGEVVQQLPAMRGVHDLRMEHSAVVTAVIISNHGKRRTFASRDDAEARRQAGNAVAVAHPHLLAGAGRPNAMKQRTVIRDIHHRGAELVVVADADLATQLRAHDLLPVTDAEHGQAGIEHHLWHARAGPFRYAGRPSRQDEGAGAEGANALRGDIGWEDLAIHPGFADSPGDQLGELAAEIQDQHPVLGRDRGNGLGHGAGSSMAGAGRQAACLTLGAPRRARGRWGPTRRPPAGSRRPPPACPTPPPGARPGAGRTSGWDCRAAPTGTRCGSRPP